MPINVNLDAEKIMASKGEYRPIFGSCLPLTGNYILQPQGFRIYHQYLHDLSQKLREFDLHQ